MPVPIGQDAAGPRQRSGMSLELKGFHGTIVRLRRGHIRLADNRNPPSNGETVYAALVTLTIDPDQAPAAAAVLTNDILPTLRAAPGFVAGYWLDPSDDQGFSIVVFESEEQARQSVPPASNWAAPGVTINSVDFRRVAATLP